MIKYMIWPYLRGTCPCIECTTSNESLTERLSHQPTMDGACVTLLRSTRSYAAGVGGTGPPQYLALGEGLFPSSSMMLL